MRAHYCNQLVIVPDQLFAEMISSATTMRYYNNYYTIILVNIFLFYGNSLYPNILEINTVPEIGLTRVSFARKILKIEARQKGMEIEKSFF